MQLCQRLEQILGNLRPAFSREATFQWFILLVWGVVLNSQPSAITSYVNALGLTESYYHQALHWFDPIFRTKFEIIKIDSKIVTEQL